MKDGLQIKKFPAWLKKRLAQKALERETTLTQIVIEIITKALNGNASR
jgi:hypothetical protein